MTNPNWSLREAESRFGAVVDAAVAGEPQLVTRDGKPAVVVVAAETFERLKRLERTDRPSFADLLLSMPQDGGSFEHSDVPPREIDF